MSLTVSGYIVIENTPGYMPESDDPFVTQSYEEAVRYANELADELEEQGYTVDRSWASADNYTCIHATKPDEPHDLGRVIQVMNHEEELE